MSTSPGWRAGLGGGVTSRAVVVASSDPGIRLRLKEQLTGMRWTVGEAAGGVEAMAQVERDRPEALLVDGWLPDLEVGEFAGQMQTLYPRMDVLRMDGSVQGGGEGARSPRRNELLHAIRSSQEQGVYAAGAAVEEAAVAVLAQPTATAVVESLPGMVGQSAAMLELARMIRLVAPRSATVLIEGETGTGKEVVAKAVHGLSARVTKPFVVLNCAAIPEALLEAELFGHVRGAFTGAVQSRTGRIEAAHGGTLFLDEIGEMPLALQAKMLRFLECGEIQKVGENEMMRVDVRVIAATHQHLKERAALGTFRLDLYHRLAVFPLCVPALRKRMEDVPALVEFILEQMGKTMPRKTVSGEAMARLLEDRWPGNVRELMHRLERASILAGNRAELRAEDVTAQAARQE